LANAGYEATTLRDVAGRAGVSAGLLYRYFPSKRSIVLALYDELSDKYAQQATEMPPGTWRSRFIYALETSIRVLGPHRVTLRALVPVMVGDVDEGLFARSTAFSRLRVQTVFQDAVVNATDAPKRTLAEPIGRLLYLLHLAVNFVVVAGQESRAARNPCSRRFVPAAAAFCSADPPLPAGSALRPLGR
jgi:AcrR family transcriptional regulator